MSPLRSSDPERLGGYVLVGRLGVGGMGVVYLAESDDGTYVAIKLIHAALGSDPEFIGRFRSEVERARQVPAYCTAEFLDADLDHDPPYLVVEYVDGPSLDEVVEERGPLRGGALHSLAVGVATALTGIHGAGVIHRDLKPDNVLLPPGSPKVIDFGIARAFEATTRHTRTDVMVGTVAYMSPERFSDDPDVTVSAAADIFAWGCVITYAGTGRTPFRGDSASATAARILTQPPRLDGLPESLREPVRLSLSKDPADRPTAPELLAMLLGAEQPPPSNATTEVAAPAPPAPPAPKRSLIKDPYLIALLTILLLATLTILGLTLGAGGTAHSAGTPSAGTTGATANAATALVPSESASPSHSPSASATPSHHRTSPPVSKSPSASPSVHTDGIANPSGRNLALNKTATASSEEGQPWGAAQAVDGDLESRWSSGFSDPQWLAVDLGANYRISTIVVRWENAYAIAYKVQVSTDGTTWANVYSTANGGGGDVTVTAKTTARYVRMYGTKRSGQYGYSIYELEVR